MSEARIIGRPMVSDIGSSATPSLKSLEVSESLGVICGRPDDLHYELDEQGENEDLIDNCKCHIRHDLRWLA